MRKYMNCVFVCVFNEDKYVDMFLLLLESLVLYGNMNREIQLVVYTSTPFMNKIKQSLWNESILFEINDSYNTIEKACFARLDAFELPLLNNYQKILYLDTDILVKENLNLVFDVCKEDLLYVLEEGDIQDENGFWGRTLFGNEIYNYPDKSGFTSGILLFHHCEKIKDLFHKIKEDIVNRPGGSFYDQPYIVYNAFKYKLYNNKILKSLAINQDSNIYSDKAIHHFPGGPGVYGHKIDSMTLFLNDIHQSKCIHKFVHCVFVCVFNEEKYVDMFLLLLESILLYGNTRREIQLVVYTSTPFMKKIKQSPLWDESILFELNDTYDTIQKACYARLDAFQLPLLKRYQKILYLDTDILIKESLNSVFDMCQDDLLYVLEEGKLTNEDDYGGKSLFQKEIFNYPNESGFTTGMMLFKRCNTIHKLFDTIRTDILRRNQVFRCYDQPYIVYHAIRENLCSKTLGTVGINNHYSMRSTKTIYHFPGFPGVYEEKIIKMETFLNHVNKERCKRGMRIINRTIPPIKQMFSLVGLCVSYQYFDTLQYTLPVNYIHFEKLYIITQHDDKETIDFCRKFSNVEILYYSFKTPGKAFDKFGAMNMGQAIMYRHYPDAWYVNLDSDILLPNNLIDLLLEENLNKDCIYGGIRNNVYQTSELLDKKKVIENKENTEFAYNDLRTIPDTPLFILGCFQLYKKKVFHRDDLKDAGYGDVCFCQDNFQVFCVINNIFYYHLGAGSVNWSGKVVSFIKDVPITPVDLYYTCHKECTHTYYNKSCEIVHYSPCFNIEEDLWTCSEKMRIDLGNFFRDKSCTIAEIGSHKGYTTRILSTMFQTVYSVDNHLEWTRMNKQYNRDMRNIYYISLDLYKEDWNVLPDDIEVVFIDADHSYHACKSDLLNAAKRFKHLKYVIFDDYGVWKGVKQLVDEYVQTKKLKIEKWIGIQNVPGPYGIVQNTHEGVICSIQKPVSSRFSIPIRKTSGMKLHTNYRPNP